MTPRRVTATECERFLCETGPAALRRHLQRIEDIFLKPVRAAVCGAWYGIETYWNCESCGRPQAGESPWPAGQKRCIACGPGDGYVPCPATHTKKPCPLCKGHGFVEELR